MRIDPLNVLAASVSSSFTFKLIPRTFSFSQNLLSHPVSHPVTVPPRKSKTLSSCCEAEMAAAGEGRWPNKKEEYELQEVIGIVLKF